MWRCLNLVNTFNLINPDYVKKFNNAKTRIKEDVRRFRCKY